MNTLATMFRFPDMPRLSSPVVLPTLKAGEWIAQFKMNGWRALVEWDGKRVASVTSRHNKPLPCSPPVVRALEASLRRLPPALFDGEWMGRRATGGDKSFQFPERFWLFDLLAENGKWLGGLTCDERLSALMRMMDDADSIGLVPATTRADYPEFFRYAHQFETAGCEGLVLKRNVSRYVGSPRDCAENPGWIKVKWLGGENGQTVIA